MTRHPEGTRTKRKGGEMEARLAPEVRVRVFDPDCGQGLYQSAQRVNDWFCAEESKERKILDVSVSGDFILVTFEVGTEATP